MAAPEDSSSMKTDCAVTVAALPLAALRPARKDTINIKTILYIITLLRAQLLAPRLLQCKFLQLEICFSR